LPSPRIEPIMWRFQLSRSNLVFLLLIYSKDSPDWLAIKRNSVVISRNVVIVWSDFVLTILIVNSYSLSTWWCHSKNRPMILLFLKNPIWQLHMHTALIQPLYFWSHHLREKTIIILKFISLQWAHFPYVFQLLIKTICQLYVLSLAARVIFQNSGWNKRPNSLLKIFMTNNTTSLYIYFLVYCMYETKYFQIIFNGITDLPLWTQHIWLGWIAWLIYKIVLHLMCIW
jgi:hypothetical protein